MMKVIASVVIIGLCVVLVPVASMADSKVEAARYRLCVKKAQDDPKAALDMAMAWRARGGGVPVKHCMALALFNLKRYEDAARKFESIAVDLQTGRGTFGLDGLSNADLLAAVNGQQGNAWLMAGNYSKAYSVISTAMADVAENSPQYLELLIDRARSLAGMGQYQKALDDLNEAQKIAPKRADIYVYRASAQRALKVLDAAQRDLMTALALDPDNPDALLERGIVNRLSGDDDSARRDWSSVIEKYPGSPEAKAAQDNLKLIEKSDRDVKSGPDSIQP